MERQRSFSFRPTRLLVFSFTICSSVFFLTFFTIWVIKSTPLLRQETHIQLNESSMSLGLQSITVQSLIGFSTNASVNSSSSSIMMDTHLNLDGNATGFSGISVISGLRRKNDSESEVVGAEENNGGDSTGRKFSTTAQKLPKGSYTEKKVSVGEKIEEKNVGATLFKKFEVPISRSVEKKNSKVRSSSGKFSILSTEVNKKQSKKGCDFTIGKWIYDATYPLYSNRSCPFVDEGFNCEANGRPDKDYMKWRWEPEDCSIPRFNATTMLELIRGKRLVFVGDSINRNQWESMLCMLMGAITNPKKVYETHGRRITKEKGNYSFKFVDYKCTVEYYVSHFLVHESKARVGQKRIKTLRIDAIDHGSSRWRGADILVFNTAHWWSHYKTKSGINYYQEGSVVHPRLDVFSAFRKALTTWSSWVDRHINPHRTQVFFRNSSPSHFRGGEWNLGGHCTEATKPLAETLGSFGSDKRMIVEEVIKQMKTPVTLLNITSLSGYRIDGHPSVYGKRSGKHSTSSFQDCSHWCLPGVPDSWNEILFAHLQSKRLQTG